MKNGFCWCKTKVDEVGKKGLWVGKEDNGYGENVLSWIISSISDDMARIKKMYSCLNEAENLNLSLFSLYLCVCMLQGM